MGSTGKAKLVTSTPPTSSNVTPTVSVAPVNGNNPNVANQVPNSSNTPVVNGALNQLTSMSDDEMAAAVIASRSVQMPNLLNDSPDQTQKFVFQIGLNEKPQVLDTTQFNQFIADNNIKSNQLMARSVNPITYTNADNTRIKLTSDQIISIMRDSRLNYIGGKHGGQAYGAGTYFDMNGGRNTGYGGSTVRAVLNPATAKVISLNQLSRDVGQWAQAHPKTARALGSFTKSNASIYALCMGYNVINSGSGYGISPNEYHNVIDRSALVYEK